jgi:isopenicillin N synthase-like dioxygenase
MRAGKHSDIGCLTLLFQRDGQDGLEICPGKDSSYSVKAEDDVWTPLPAKTGPIVVNIGDMLSKSDGKICLVLRIGVLNRVTVAWSDDRLKSTFHRVRANEVGHSPSRYSIAYFNQSRGGVVLQGPKKK